MLKKLRELHLAYRIYRRFACFCRKVRNYLHYRAHVPCVPGKIHLAVDTGGGLGDLIIQRKTLQKLAESAPDVVIIVFGAIPETTRWVFGNALHVAAVLGMECLPHFRKHCADAVLELNTLANFTVLPAKRPRLKQLAPELLKRIDATNQRVQPWQQYRLAHPGSDGELARRAVADGWTRYTLLDALLGLPEEKTVLELPCNNTLSGKIAERFPCYVTVNTGFDRNMVSRHAKLATKCYPLASWERLLALLHERYPEIRIVQLGSANSPALAGIDCDLTGKTTLSECAGVLQRSVLHLDMEGGLVHLATALGTRCAVLFGPTNQAYFSYPENINISAGDCHDCWWSTPGWMERCPKGHAFPQCMQAIKPEQIMQKIAPVLDHLP